MLLSLRFNKHLLNWFELYSCETFDITSKFRFMKAVAINGLSRGLASLPHKRAHVGLCTKFRLPVFNCSLLIPPRAKENVHAAAMFLFCLVINYYIFFFRFYTVLYLML
jgi:hypothetical protein